MDRRLLDVTARTTLDFLDARAEGVDWTDEAAAVLDVYTPRDDEAVTLALELDPSDLEHVPQHADRVGLSAEQARTLAADLEAAADAAERDEAYGRSRRG